MIEVRGGEEVEGIEMNEELPWPLLRKEGELI